MTCPFAKQRINIVNKYKSASSLKGLQRTPLKKASIAELMNAS